MSVTEVVKQLRSRGIIIGCVAWHPWIHDSTLVNKQPLGFDSCAIFYIGGSVKVEMLWNLNHINIFTAVADDINGLVAQRVDAVPEAIKKEELALPVYDTNCPGQQ